MLKTMRNWVARRCLSLLAICASLVIAACGGSPLPEGLGTGGAPPPGSNQPTKEFSVTPQVFGEDGTGTSSAARVGRGTRSTSQIGLVETRLPPSSRRGDMLGVDADGRTLKSAIKQGVGEIGTGSGSNGNDLVDLNGNNLFVSGLSGTAINATIVFKTQGDNAVLGTVNVTGLQTNATPVNLSGTALGAGQNLLVEISVSGGVTTAVVPSTFFQSGERYGFNIIRRANGSLVVELFQDTLAPFGVSDNGSRVVIDTDVDALKNGVRTTVARFETPDGLILFDSNLDGIFGTPQDAVILFDTNSDGVIDNKDQPVSFALDPNLDGVTGPTEQRLLGNNIPEDFINDVQLTASPTEVVGNGLSVVTVRAVISPAFDGIPIGATLTFEVERIDGTEQEGVLGGAGARFMSNGQATSQREVNPLSPSVRILAGGLIEVTEAVRSPVFSTDGTIRVSVRYRTSTSIDDRRISSDVVVKRNTAPTLSSVTFAGTVDVSPSVTGLFERSSAAKIVEGNVVEIQGTNFVTDPAALNVTFGGVPGVVHNDLTSTRIRVFVPVGARTGTLAVIQGSMGANTSEEIVISGPAIALESSLPSNGATNVGLEGSISLRFNQAMKGSSLEGGIELRELSGASAVVVRSLSTDGQTVTLTPSVPLQPNTVYEIALTGYLEAASGAFFDPILDDSTPARGNVKTVVGSFTTTATAGADITPPTVVSADLIPPATRRDSWVVQVTFSEGINPGSITATNPAVETDTVIFSAGSGGDLAAATKLPMSVTFSGTNGEIMRASLLTPPDGRATYTLTLASSVADASNNALGAVYTQAFTTPLRIDGLSKISGPPGSQTVIDGSTFDPVDVSVTFASATGRTAATIIDASSFDITVVVPTDAVDGPVEVTVASQVAVSPRPFAVTSAGFTPRVIATGAGAFGIAVGFDDIALVSFQESGALGLVDLTAEQAIDLDTTTPETVDGINVGGVPTDAKLDATGTVAFTTNYGTVQTPGSTVFVLDMVTRQPKAAIPVGERPTRIAISPDNRRAYVTNFLSDSVSVIDIESLAVENTVPVGIGPNGIAIAPNNLRGYVCNFLDGTVTVFDVQTLLPIATIPVGANPTRVMLSSDSNTLFVTNFGDNTISIIDTQTQEVKQLLTGFAGPSAMVFSSDQRRMFVTNRLQDTIQELVVAENGQWGPGAIRIATSTTPAGVTISVDGALLAFTTEGAGEVAIVTIGDPQPVIAGFSIDENDRDVRATFSVDRRQPLWIRGRGFGSSPEELTVTLDGIELPLLPSSSATRNKIKVDIVEAARSGSVVVRRAITAADIRTSNSLPLLVTRKNPTVVSISPGDGAAEVPGSSPVVIDFSEPLNPSKIFAADGRTPNSVGDAKVVRVVRLSDDGGQPADVEGSWRLTSQGFRLEFSPSLADALIAPGSNNVYEVVVSTSVEDLFRNSVLGAATSYAGAADSSRGSSTTIGVNASSLGFRSRFQTTDLLGPRIIEAVYRDINNNGVDAGDQLELRFDEDLRYQVGSFDIAGGLQLTGATGDSLGAVVNATLGRSPRHLLLTLGVGATFDLAGSTPVSVNVVTGAIGQVTDYRNNRPSASGAAVRITLDPASDNRDNPYLLAAYVFDLDSSGGVSNGDELRLTFNEPVRRGTVALAGVPSDFVDLSGGAVFGSSAFIVRVSGDDFRTLRILLNGSTITAGGATPTELSLKTGTVPIPNGQPAMNPNTFVDLIGNPAYSGSATLRTIGLGLPGPSVQSTEPAGRPRYYDIEGTLEGLSEGDAVVVTFSNPVFFNPLAAGSTTRPADAFGLGVRGDRFGQGARIAQPAFITPRGQTPVRILPNQIVIFLGTEPVLRLDGDFGDLD